MKIKAIVVASRVREVQTKEKGQIILTEVWCQQDVGEPPFLATIPKAVELEPGQDVTISWFPRTQIYADEIL